MTRNRKSPRGRKYSGTRGVYHIETRGIGRVESISTLAGSDHISGGMVFTWKNRGKSPIGTKKCALPGVSSIEGRRLSAESEKGGFL